ncbi:MAG: S-methyl-5-thioribose kinase, partial [Angelakisella sp.]
EECTEIMAKTVGFSEWFIGDMLTDAAGVAGLELIRRIIGDAKVRDIEGIADVAERVRAERICVLAAKQFIKNRSSAYQDGMDYIDTVKKVRSRLLADGEPI